MENRRLGYLTTNPANLGTALKISARVKLPILAKNSRLAALLKSFGLDSNYKMVAETQNVDLASLEESEQESSIVEISTVKTLGVTEVNIYLFFFF